MELFDVDIVIVDALNQTMIMVGALASGLWIGQHIATYFALTHANPFTPNLIACIAVVRFTSLVFKGYYNRD